MNWLVTPVRIHEQGEILLVVGMERQGNASITVCSSGFGSAMFRTSTRTA